MAERVGPTLLNLPSPTSGIATPSDAGPSTPGSTTTSMSALSTTAIKDGHLGNNPHLHPHVHSHLPTTSTLAAERADRISRLSGMSDLSAARSPGTMGGQPNGYFDNANQSPMTQRSTIGSASGSSMRMTGTSDFGEGDRDDFGSIGASETTGVSDETTGTGSYVGFGEAANDLLDKADEEHDETTKAALRKKALLLKQQEEQARDGNDVVMGES